MNLKNQTAIITGASSGLGESLAYKLAIDEQVRVILIARSKDLLKKVTEKISKSGGRAEYFVCDISNLEQIRETKKILLSNIKK